jgi:hypothetical protein
MTVALYVALLPICSIILCIFGFFIGRCSRKVPILDNNLPRVLYRGQLPAHDLSGAEDPQRGRCNKSGSLPS